MVVEAVEAESSGDGGSFDVPEEHRTGSVGHSHRAVAARTPRMHPEAGSECYTPQHMAGMVFDVHYLQQNVDM